MLVRRDQRRGEPATRTKGDFGFICEWLRVFQEGLLSHLMAFLPIPLMVQLAKSIWQQAAPELSDVTISSATREERSFWQHVHLAFVTQLAARLTDLTTITLRYPIGFLMWCFDVFVAMIEGHIARRADNLGDGTLHTLTIEDVRLTGAAMQTLSRTHPPFPARLDPPPTLHALTTIKGLYRGYPTDTNGHQALADRGWLMPSLATVQQEGWSPDRLGQLISSSRSLRCVDDVVEGRIGGEEWAGEDWADVFEGIPAVPAGQQGGPLAQLESIGTIVVLENDPEGIYRLRVITTHTRVQRGLGAWLMMSFLYVCCCFQEVLVARGCRRLKKLHVRFGGIGRPTFPVLLAVERLVGACCRPDAPLTLTTTDRPEFDLSIFCHPNFPTTPSPSFKAMVQQLARQATSVVYIFTQDGLTDQHTNPSPSAIDIASSLSFDKAETVVEVKNANGFNPPANTPSPDPTIITHLQPFSTQATELRVVSSLGGAAAQLLAAKMPNVGRVDFEGAPELGDGERVDVLAAVGSEREVGDVWMGEVDVDQFDRLLVGAAGSLPAISGLNFTTTRMLREMEVVPLSVLIFALCVFAFSGR